LVTIVYDRDGTHYGIGAGLSVYVDGRQTIAPSDAGKKTVKIDEPPATKSEPLPLNLANNFRKSGFPIPSASVNDSPEELYEAIDGRVWFYPNVKNYWSTAGSGAVQDWYALDFGHAVSVRSVKLYFYSDGRLFMAPDSYALESWTGGDWAAVPGAVMSPDKPLGNGDNRVSFPPVETSRLRVVLNHPKNAAVGLVEIQVY
jgi:hypothetical protein